jgi:hypothetical protein
VLTGTHLYLVTRQCVATWSVRCLSILENFVLLETDFSDLISVIDDFTKHNKSHYDHIIFN